MSPKVHAKTNSFQRKNNVGAFIYCIPSVQSTSPLHIHYLKNAKTNSKPHFTIGEQHQSERERERDTGQYFRGQREQSNGGKNMPCNTVPPDWVPSPRSRALPAWEAKPQRLLQISWRRADLRLTAKAAFSRTEWALTSPSRPQIRVALQWQCEVGEEHPAWRARELICP